MSQAATKLANLLALPATLSGLLGRVTLKSVLYWIDTTTFLFTSLRQWRRRSSLLNRATYTSLVTQLIFTGIDAFPFITVLSLAIGLGLTTQLLSSIEVIGTTQDVVALLTELVALELGSLLTAMLIIGRSGSAIAVDLGNMKLHREIEALELLGINVDHFFVVPRIIGTAIAQLCLSVYFSIIAVASGVIFAGLLLSPGYFKYLAELPLAFNPLDLVVFLIKNLAFGLIIGTIACYHGLRVGTSPTEVPQQTQKAIVNSMLLIFLLDGVIALTLQ